MQANCPNYPPYLVLLGDNIALIKVPAAVQNGPIYVAFKDRLQRSIVVFFHYGAKQNLPAGR